MKKIIITILFFVSAIPIVRGQNQILQKINDIKSQSNLYFWSQYAHPNADTARINATRWLLIEINGKRSEDEEIPLEDVAGKIKHIKMERGGVIRDFAYIAKADIGNVSETGISDSQSKVVNFVQDKFVPELFVQKIIEQNSFQAVYNYLKGQKAEGTILQFGALKDIDDYSSLDLILFDLNSKCVISILSGTTSGGGRINMMTGMPDSLENYPEEMTAVIWYIK